MIMTKKKKKDEAIMSTGDGEEGEASSWAAGSMGSFAIREVQLNDVLLLTSGTSAENPTSLMTDEHSADCCGDTSFSNVSELSSVEHHHPSNQGQVPSIERIPNASATVQQLMISSERRRQERRRWNPSLNGRKNGQSAVAAPAATVTTYPIDVAQQSSSVAVQQHESRRGNIIVSTGTASGDEESREQALQPVDQPTTVNINSRSISGANQISSERSTGQPPDPPPNPRATPTTTTTSITPQVLQNQDAAAPTLQQESSSSASPFTHIGAPDSKYRSYTCLVDRAQSDKSLEIHLYSAKRPHMRAFQFSWWAFFIAFFTWFAITPLLSEVQTSLGLSKRETWISNTFAVAGSAIMRVASGPLCDKYGARWIMAATLLISAVPTGLMGTVQTVTGFYILRLVVGVAGAAFVTSQYWTSSMFTVEVVGTANALVAGWGNLGGGVTQIVMGSLLFPLFKTFFGGEGFSAANLDAKEFDRASDLAWRTIMVFPAILCLGAAYIVVKFSDDSPKGNYSKRNQQGFIPNVSALEAIKLAASDCNTWLLCAHYACCFGVEITMINGLALYFTEEFDQSTESAAAIASIFGWMNLFARGVGGFASDMVNAKYGMRGRLWIHVFFLVLDGCLVIAFGRAETLSGAILVMIVFSIFVQAAEGSTYSILPYVQPSVTGSTAGVVGAGGNIGGVIFSLIFAEYNYRKAFTLLGIIAICSAVLTAFISIRGHAGLFVGEDSAEVTSRRSDHNESFGNVPPVTATTPTPRPVDIEIVDESQPHQGSCSSAKDDSTHLRFGSESVH